MRTYRWLTLSAAIVITGLEAWLFAGASAAAASQTAVPMPVVTITAARDDTPRARALDASRVHWQLWR